MTFIAFTYIQLRVKVNTTNYVYNVHTVPHALRLRLQYSNHFSFMWPQRLIEEYIISTWANAFASSEFQEELFGTFAVENAAKSEARSNHIQAINCKCFSLQKNTFSTESYFYLRIELAMRIRYAC